MSARIGIIGAGLGGLTAALALRRAGFAVAVYEQARALGEAGAGLTVSRGAQHVFRALGVQDRLAPLMTRSTAFPFVHYRTGRVLAGILDTGPDQPDDGRADISRQCHRADLHAVLTEAFAGPIHLDHRLVGIEERAHGVRAVFANGAAVDADLLIAADGVRSAVRPILWGDAPPRFTGQIAYRFLLDGATAQPFMGLGRGAVWIGPGRTFNRYTLRSGAIVNCVGIVATDEWAGEGWSTPASSDALLADFAGWHQDVVGLMQRADGLIKWGLFDRAPLPRWSQGPVTLLGDAAHAMLPFMGMGAAMAIEDAMILARALVANGAAEPALARYESARRPRTELLHAKSIEQGELTQARDPDHYDPGNAPAADPVILGYDPVTAPI